MDSFLAFVSGTLNETWSIFNQSSPYVLFGFTLAAILKAFIPDEFVSKQLGGNGPWAVLKAAIIGVPLPVCSCGVVPMAMGLRRQGASRSATSAFMISTPETGVDSIAITYAMLDPIMTVFRPLAAFVTAVVAGLLENRFAVDETPVVETMKVQPACGCGECAMSVPDARKDSFARRTVNSFNYAFGELLPEIGLWLIGGIVAAGVISYMVPEDFFVNKLGGGIGQMLLMLAVGIPIYMCASCSTPVAAALVLKGLSPGAALVLLLTGPATNASTIAMFGKIMGRRSLGIYVTSIAVVAIVLGLLLDWLYWSLGLKLTPAIASDEGIEAGWFGIAATIVLLALIARGVILSRIRRDKSCPAPS